LAFWIFDAPATPDQIWTEPHSQLGYILNRSRRGINSLGIRERPVTRKQGEKRILVLGDSISFGNHSFPRLLERRFEIRTDPQSVTVEVFNAGIPGYTTYQEVTWYELFGHQIEPDLVLLQFCLNDTYLILSTVDKDGRLHATPDVWAHFAGVDPAWFRASRVVAFVIKGLTVVKANVALFFGTRYSFEAKVDFYRAWEDDAWVEIQNLLERLHNRVNHTGGKLAIVVFPYGQQLRPEYLDKDPDRVLMPQRKLREIANRLRIPLLDVFEIFRGRRDLLPDDIHPTAQGHALVAEEVYRFLQREALI